MLKITPISPGLFTLRIVKESETIRVREGSAALVLRCVLSGDVRNVQARWLSPGDVGRIEEQITPEGRELWLTIENPSQANAGVYACQASRSSDTVNVVVEPLRQSASHFHYSILINIIPTNISHILPLENLHISFPSFTKLILNNSSLRVIMGSSRSNLRASQRWRPTYGIFVCFFRFWKPLQHLVYYYPC